VETRPSADDYQPPITPWGHTWRIALCLLLSGLAWSATFVPQWELHPGLWALDLVVGLVAYVLTVWRRRHPLAVAVSTNALMLVSGVAAGPATLAAVSLATRQRLLPIVLVSVVGITAAQGYVDVMPTRNDDPWWLSFAFNVVITVAVMGWGMFIGSRRQVMWELRQRALRAEAEQGVRVAQARGTERARIAREMHDVLAHRISQISMQAGAMAFREDLGAEDLRQGAGVIQEQAHEALTELRDVLGVLRDETSGELLDRPQPTYADLPRLVDDARAAGLTLTFHDCVTHDGEPVPEVAGRTVYRIVQEGITNARKHAPGATLTVEVTGDPEAGLDVRVRNPLGFGPSRTPGAGLGLIGLTERAELRGGRLEHGPAGQSFELHGWIPWRP
jgi:signal transduction histidine kinase